MTRCGRLIALEGGEGAGKSTQALRLAATIAADVSREPGGSLLGERVRQLLLDPGQSEAPRRIDARAELMLMLAARAQHVSELIRPRLESGRDVVVDRYSGSTLAYQGYGRGLPLEEIRQACDLATGGLWPDLTILLDVPVDVGVARRATAGSAPDRIEAERDGFHVRVREGFLAEAAGDPDHWVVIDGTLDPGDVERLVLAAVDQMPRCRE